MITKIIDALKKIRKNNASQTFLSLFFYALARDDIIE
jgi:hypothetical protein